jgi:hypothetical protein
VRARQRLDRTLNEDGQSQTIQGSSFDSQVVCETGSYTNTSAPAERGVEQTARFSLILTCSSGSILILRLCTRGTGRLSGGLQLARARAAVSVVELRRVDAVRCGITKRYPSPWGVELGCTFVVLHTTQEIKRGKEALEAWKLGAGKARPVTRTPRDQRADNVRITSLASSVF